MMQQLSRRSFLKLLGIGGVTLPQVGQAFAGPFSPTLDARDPAMHVIKRLTFGPTNVLVTHIRDIGHEAFIQEQLAPENIDDSEIEARLRIFPDLNKTPGEIFEQYEQQAGQVGFQLVGQRVLRAMYSRRQLYERLVHFWSDHFNTDFGSAALVVLKVSDERDVLRRHAMGRFRDILGASAHSPAMLLYLDNALSNQDAPNENYARELLELHTLGIDGGYTEQDVKEVARCFTGWTITRPRRQRGNVSDSGQFQFVPRLHDDGEKVVLGHVIPAGGGPRDGEMVLDILAGHSSTARFISTKLIRRFVADEPPASLVEAGTQTFLQTDGDIRAVLRTIFSSEEFYNAPPKFQRPFEYTMSVLRVLNYDIQNIQGFGRVFREAMLNMGHMPFQHPSPDGYPDVQTEWADNLLMRWNIAIAAVHGDIPGASGSLRPLLEANNIPLEPEAIINFFAELFYGRALNEEERQIIFNYLSAGDGVEYLQDALALMLAAPAYQYR